MLEHILCDILHGLLFPALTVGAVVEDDGRTITGNDDIPVITVEPGRLYLGELTSSEDTKRLTMMRLELGSPVVGSLAVSGLETNGKWFP